MESLEDKIKKIEELVKEANKFAETTGQKVEVEVYVNHWESSDEEWNDSGCEWSSSSEYC